MFSEAEPRGASRVEGKLGSTFTSDQFLVICESYYIFELLLSTRKTQKKCQNGGNST